MPFLLAAQCVKSPTATLVLAVCATILLVALAIDVVYFVWREWRTFYRRHDKLSRELDHDYDQWRELVVAMRPFPRAEPAR